MISHRIWANRPCTFKTGGRTNPGRTAFWANRFGGEHFLGERTAIRHFDNISAEPTVDLSDGEKKETFPTMMVASINLGNILTLLLETVS